MRRPSLPTLVLAACIGVTLLILSHRPTRLLLAGGDSVEDVVRRMGERIEERLRPRFEAAGIELPPAEVRLVGFKREKRLELWVRAEGAGERWTLVHTYRVLAASGNAGPKLREGDRQVPEGIYAAVALNPNSRFHLSIKLDFPSAFDLERAREDGRTDPGSDIFIHGKDRSVGCLAVGDEAIEELFVLTATVGIDSVSVILAPYEPGPGVPLVPPEGSPPWTQDLYRSIDEALAVRGS